MVVYEKTSRFSFHLLHEAKSKVRISQNTYKNSGNLQEEPMQRAFDALRDFVTISDSFKVRKVLCVATSALRNAPNKKEFTDRVKKELKLKIKIIDGQREAYLGAIACANLLPKQSNALTIDIGGGSTEFSMIDNKDVSHTLSLELGTVRVKELFFDKNNIDEAKEYIDSKLELLEDINPSTIIGIGGTFRALSGAIMQKQEYPLNKLHAFEYEIKELQKLISNILNATSDRELKELNIDSNRYDIIKPGALIVERVLHKFKIENIITSGVGVREGVYLSDLLRHSKDKLPLNYNTSVRYILDSHVDDKNYSNQLSKLSKKIFDLTAKEFEIDEKYRVALSVASKLYPSGSNVHFYSQNKHSYYLILTALEYGFRHDEIVLIATLTKYAKRKQPSTSHIKKYKKLLPDEKRLNILSSILSLSIALLTHKPRNIDFDITFEDGVLNIESKKSLYLSKNALKKLSLEKDFRVNF
jgi:exopolyphosphatase/guanosine-5'-triphosphate,3'-diphosphate pyrophosphatase